jgi:hypothetical protein
MRAFIKTAATLAMILPFVTASIPAAAEDPAARTLNWLSAEPVTLMDLGMMRLRDDLTMASNELMDIGYTNRPPKVGTYYEWRESTIYAYVAVREPFAKPSERTCLDIFARVMRRIADKAPGGSRSVGWYLESLFMHEGPGNYGRPKNMQEGLLNAVKFEVSVLPPDPMKDSGKVSCSGRMDADLGDVAVAAS